MSQTRRRIKRGPLAVGLTLLTCAAGVALSANIASAQDPAAQFSKNAAGDTYGSAMGSVNPDSEPDLIRAMATNGKEGYVRGSDLDPPELQPANPTEATAMREASEQKAADKLVEVLGNELGIKIDASKEQELAALESIDPAALAGAGSASIDDGTIQALAQALGTDLAAAARSGHVGVDQAVSAAVEAASTANTRVIPVFKSDGKTQIGTFEVG